MQPESFFRCALFFTALPLFALLLTSVRMSGGRPIVLGDFLAEGGINLQFPLDRGIISFVSTE